MSGMNPVRPWLIWDGDDLYGDYRTEADRRRDLIAVMKCSSEITISHWDQDGFSGPAWTDPRPPDAADLGEDQEGRRGG